MTTALVKRLGDQIEGGARRRSMRAQYVAWATANDAGAPDSLDDQIGCLRTARKVVMPQTLTNVIEPPAYDTIESMISTIEQHMKGATS